MGLAHPELHFDSPAIVFGGPYGNLEATRALLDEAARLGIPPQRIVCTGDVVAYGADAAATVDLVRAAGIHVVMGNCEESLASAAADCGCGYVPGSACDRLAAAWFAHADRELGADARAWMAQLPRRIDLVIAGARLVVVHGAIDRINRFIFATTAAAIKADELARSQADGVIAGHCGLPFTQVVAGRLWHNAGAVGMPANDGTARVWFSLLTPRDGGIAVAHRALEYDYAAAAAKMRRAGLPEDYAAALETGLWPSCDVLPFKEIRERGVPLEPGAVFWQLPTAGAAARRRSVACKQLWPDPARDSVARLPREKFVDPRVTAAGEPRAEVALQRLRTLWFNTGTLCNIACRNCYIESSPKNDRLVYIDRAEVAAYLDEIERDGWDTEEIGFTGGEPFMNPHLFAIVEECLTRGFRVLVLTNAMRPMQRAKAKLLDLKRRLGERLTIRVSLDHFTAERHEDERGPGTYQPTLDGLIWLARNGVNVAVAGRTMWGENEAAERDGYARLFAQHEIPIDAHDPETLVLFPEMDARADVDEIADGAWVTHGKSPSDMMCATSRMVVKRKGADQPAVLACTLIPYDAQFELGPTLKDAARPVPLNHPHCARFCVIGGALCSAG
ncbi:MAG: radical SAM protein [Hyphomicrobiales bacterium]|nr:radical SAM protein [Hyphomicrobiales bacterium]MBV8826103.1 radical SAM protein [Hyphomicrobiales bacterium]MBV9429198.1 radical SAM protein [Bradyrhizobiaceae bacterium]